jgi:hypothetical protein
MAHVFEFDRGIGQGIRRRGSFPGSGCGLRRRFDRRVILGCLFQKVLQGHLRFEITLPTLRPRKDRAKKHQEDGA